MPRFLSSMRSWWYGVRRGRALDAEMEEEFRLHIELRAADLQRAGMPADEALRRARVEFGGVYDHAQQGREARGLAWFDWLRFSWLDFKLGARMIVKYPGLTLMGTLAIGVAIAIGAGVTGAITAIENPRLPLDEGDRVVGMQVWDIESRGPERRIARDFAEWRSSLHSIRDVGAFGPAVFNLVGSDGRSQDIRGVRMSAAGFRVARVPPLLGRYLVDDDERPASPPVVVLGYDVWRSRFNADSGIVGHTTRLGGTLHTVLGVMPQGFAFPVNFDMWVPLRLDAVDYDWRSGPALFVFGRLADGATFDDARTELATRSAATAHDHPDTHRSLRARVLPYTQSWFDLDDPDVAGAFGALKIIAILLVVVICVNVATLVYARTVTRQTEIAVRSALGATRSRIVAQFFGEACVLAGCGAAVGLGLIAFIAACVKAALVQLGAAPIPFWIRFDASGPTPGYVAALAIFGAAIIGVLPALRATGPRVQLMLQQLAGGHSTLPMGRVWTALIIAEVAFAVALLPAAVRFSAEWLRVVGVGTGFAADQYLSATLAMETRSPDAATSENVAAFRVRFARARDQLVARLDAEPEVNGVTFADALPGSEAVRRIETDAAPVSQARVSMDAWRQHTARVRFGLVDRRYFETFALRVTGRRFGATDSDSAATAVVVNRSFVNVVLDGRNAIGRRVRTTRLVENTPAPGPWYEIVGVVDDFPASMPFPDVPHAAVYRAADIGRLYPASMTLRLRTDPGAYSVRLRGLTTTVRPDLLLREVAPLEDRVRAQHLPLQWLAVSLAVVALSVLMLSCAGVYALMSVAVTRRRREIGIRVALGAERRRLLFALFSRAAVQVGAGVSIGVVVAALFDSAVGGGDVLGPHRVMILVAVSLFMTVFGLLAALGPAQIALRIPPTEALKAE